MKIQGFFDLESRPVLESRLYPSPEIQPIIDLSSYIGLKNTRAEPNIFRNKRIAKLTLLYTVYMIYNVLYRIIDSRRKTKLFSKITHVFIRGLVQSLKS